MRILRFIFPFLFVRNWHDGAWELSHPRVILFGMGVAFILLALVLIAVLQAPIRVTAN